MLPPEIMPNLRDDGKGRGDAAVHAADSVAVRTARLRKIERGLLLLEGGIVYRIPPVVRPVPLLLRSALDGRPGVVDEVPMRIIPIPCLRDNYAYLLVDGSTAVVVDPSEAAPVEVQLAKLEVRLKAILNTHHHWDHVGGNAELLEKYPRLRVVGHASDRSRIPGQTDFVETEQVVQVDALQFRVLHNPGHTSGAVSYVIESESEGLCAFTGDTLFAAGCGRIFEGTAEQMYISLNQVLGSLPETTKFFFGHEYTENNLRFAQTLEPENEVIAEKLRRVRGLRARGWYSTPTTLAEERLTNPFLRTGEPALQAHLRASELGDDLRPVAVLACVRSMKDRF